LYGEVGMSEIKPSVVYFDGEWGIVRCVRGQEMRLRSIIALVNVIGNVRVHFLSVATTGTISSAMKKYIHKYKSSKP